MAEARRFEGTMAQKALMRLFLVGLGLVLVVVIALSQILPQALVKAMLPLLVLLFLLGYVVFLVVAQRGKKVWVDVVDARLVLDEGRAGVFPLHGATLGLWQLPSIGTVAGSVLHLHDGPRTLRVGGRDHRLPSSSIRAQVPPVDSVDVFLSASDFDALLAFCPHLFAARPHAELPFHCVLLPNPSRPRAVLAMMAPWIATLVLVLIGGGILDALESAGVRFAGALVVPLFLVLVVGGIAATVLRASRARRATLALEVDRLEVRLRDLETGQVSAAAHRSAVSVTRGRHEVVMRRAVFPYAMLTIHMPEGDPLTIGVHDTRFQWVDGVAQASSPSYIVGTPDWLSLVERFGLRATLSMSDSPA